MCPCRQLWARLPGENEQGQLIGTLLGTCLDGWSPGNANGEPDLAVCPAGFGRTLWGPARTGALLFCLWCTVGHLKADTHLVAASQVLDSRILREGKRDGRKSGRAAVFF